MTSTRSRASTSSWGWWLAVIVTVLWCGAGSAFADKKRVVVLDFEGEKADKFRNAVAKAIRKTHSVVASDKWYAAAEEMSAERVTDRNIKKIAGKLGVDAVVEGKVDKRRDEYIIRLKLRSGSTGEVIKPVSTSADNTKLEGAAQTDLRDELVAAITELDEIPDGTIVEDGDERAARPAKKKPARAIAEDDDEEPEPRPEPPPKKKPARAIAEDDDEEPEVKPGPKKKPARAIAEDDDEEPEVKPARKSGFGKGGLDKRGSDAVDDEPAARPASKKPRRDEAATIEADSEDVPLPKPKPKPSKPERSAGAADDDDEPKAKPGRSKPKRLAARDIDDDDDSIERDAELDRPRPADPKLAPGARAIDGVVGFSFAARRFTFQADGDLVAGAGIGQGKPANYKGLPVPGALLDITVYPLAIGHKRDGLLKNLGATVMFDRVLTISSEDPMGAKLPTTMQRYAFGAAFRYPLGSSASAPVVGATVRYGRQKFNIKGQVDIPNVNYTIIDPGLFFRYPLSDKLIVNLDAGVLAIAGTGAIQRGDQYGGASVLGFEGAAGADYRLTRTLFARAALRLETIGFKFNGEGDLTKNRDDDEEVDVSGARDTYLGAMVTVGYLY